MYSTWCGIQRVVRRVALLRLLERCSQRGVHILEVLLQRVLLVILNHFLTEGGKYQKEKESMRNMTHVAVV